MADEEKQKYTSTFDYANRTPYQDLIQSRYMNYQPFDALAPMQMYQNYQNGIMPPVQQPPLISPSPTPTPTPDPVVDPIAAWLGYDANANGRLGSKERRAFKAADLQGFQDWKGLGGNTPTAGTQQPMAQAFAQPTQPAPNINQPMPGMGK